jgi:cell division protein FtsQ
MPRIYVLSNEEKYGRNENMINTILLVIICILVLLIIIEVVFQFIIAPNLIVRNIVIKGGGGIPKEEILRIAGLDKKEYYFALNTQSLRKKIMEMPSVKDAKCEKVFPDSLLIQLTGRVPLASAIVQEEERSILLVFDDDGVIFQSGRNLKEINLPVLSGLQFKDYSPGTRLPEELIPFLKEMKKIKESSKSVFDFISEVKIEPVTHGDFELVFYMVPYTTRIRAGSSVNESMLIYALMVLDALKKNRIDRTVRELDFRSKEIVYQDQGGI